MEGVKIKNKKQNNILLILAFILLICFIIVGTYTWYLFFLREGSKYNYLNNGTMFGDIVLTDSGNSLYIDDAESTDEENINDVIPYIFKINNKGNKNGDYTLYIEDLPLNSINDGCTSSTLLTRDQLKYQLKLNDKIIKEDYLSNIKDNILDKRNIVANGENNYELRIYIHDEAEDWTGKHYHYRVVLNKSK